jgi:hypothetical protein
VIISVDVLGAQLGLGREREREPRVPTREGPPVLVP